MASKRIILTGGGTGGHITPLLAVAHQLKMLDPDCYIIYVGERNGRFAHMTLDDPNIDETRQIFAGKLRRYHKESWLRRLFAFRTNLLNLRDLFYFLIGALQSLRLVRKLKPDMILLKGGFVGVPIGLAAALWKKPFITHDSDAIPGLANRLVSRWATYHATGMPPENYGYPTKSIRYVGVLVGEAYKAVTPELQASYKAELNLPVDGQLLLVTGGSNGAEAINLAVRDVLPDLLETYPKLHVVHQAGVGKAGIYGDFSDTRVQVHELLKPMYMFTGASDVVITRAGANTMAELGVQGRACIVIPNPLLTGGHQLKNAEHWVAKEAVVVVDETDLKSDTSSLLRAVKELLDNPERRQRLGKNLQGLTVPNAAEKLAMLLLNPDKTE